jgi:hypothetical protein
LTDTVDLPTPPLPLITIILNLILSSVSAIIAFVWSCFVFVSQESPDEQLLHPEFVLHLSAIATSFFTGMNNNKK